MENFWNGNKNYRRNAISEAKTLNSLNTYRHKYDAFSLKGTAPGPSQTWLYADADSGNLVPFFPGEDKNHGADGGNVGLCDGHAAWITRKEYVQSHELSQENNRTSDFPK